MLSRSYFFVESMIILIIIIFLQLFSYTGINESSKVLPAAILGCGILMFLIAIGTILFKPGLILYSLDKLVILFIVSIFLSFLTAYGYWEQPFKSSFLSYRLFYIYFLYFVLVGFKMSSKEVETIIVVLFFLSLVIFLIDYFTFPDPIFSLRSEERRNGITIFFYGQGFTFLGAFYYLQKFFKQFNLFHLMWFLIGAIFLFFLTQSRMILIGLSLGFVLILLLSSLRYRFVYAVVIIAAGIVFYLASDVFKGIKEQNAEQAKFYSEDIRVQAYDFFWNDLQGGWSTIVFGNGVAAKGSDLEAITDYGIALGFYTSDVGLTGIMSFFGLFGMFIWILFFYKAFSMNLAQRFTYIKAFFLTIFVTAFTGYSIFDPGFMPATVVALYLIRLNNMETIEITNQKK